MAELNGAPHHIKLYNLPQRVEGGVKIHSADSERIYIFDHLDGKFANCEIEGSDEIMHLDASTPLVELGNGEYKIEEKDEEKTY